MPKRDKEKEKHKKKGKDEGESGSYDLRDYIVNFDSGGNVKGDIVPASQAEEEDKKKKKKKKDHKDREPFQKTREVKKDKGKKEGEHGKKHGEKRKEEREIKVHKDRDEKHHGHREDHHKHKTDKIKTADKPREPKEHRGTTHGREREKRDDHGGRAKSRINGIKVPRAKSIVR